MNHQGIACRLPVELLSMIFDCLALQELLGASHVSKFWRNVATRHRMYWSDITLEALSTTALDFFHARLDAGETRSVTLRVYMCKPKFPARLRSVVLPAITRNLYRVDSLCLEGDMADDHLIFSALRHPAPRLVTFDIYIAHNTKTSDALPPDLFASHAPRLQNLQLVNVQLRANALPAAFTTVEVLKYCFAETQSFPTAVFSHWRALKTLIIYGKYLVSDDDALSAADAAKLRFIDISLLTGSLEFMRCLPCSSIAQICVPLLDYDLAHLVLGHLRGTIEVHLDHTPKSLELLYQSLETGLQRTFVCGRGQIEEVFLPSIYVDTALLSRVQSLRSTITCAGLFPAFGELPACTRVALTMVNDEPLKAPQRALSIPELERIEIASSTPARLCASDLAAFLDAAFDSVSRAVQVTLKGLSIYGDLAAISGTRFVVSMNNQP